MRLIEERASAYADADHTIETSGKTVPEVVSAILAWLGATPGTAMQASIGDEE